MQLRNCTSANALTPTGTYEHYEDTPVPNGTAYVNTLTPAEGYTFTSPGSGEEQIRVVIRHGGHLVGANMAADIAKISANPVYNPSGRNCFNAATGEVRIDNVWGRSDGGDVAVVVYACSQTTSNAMFFEWDENIRDYYPWYDDPGVERYVDDPYEPLPTVTLNLSHCTASNTVERARTGQPYSNTLTPDEGYAFVRSGPSLGGVTYGGGGIEDGGGVTDASISLYCTVSMNGENVTAASFDISTGEVDIEEVTGSIIITVGTQQV